MLGIGLRWSQIVWVCWWEESQFIKTVRQGWQIYEGSEGKFPEIRQIRLYSNTASIFTQSLAQNTAEQQSLSDVFPVSLCYPQKGIIVTPSARQRVGRQVLWQPGNVAMWQCGIHIPPPIFLPWWHPFPPPLPSPSASSHPDTDVTDPPQIAAHESPLRTPRPRVCCLRFPLEVLLYSFCYFANPWLALSLSQLSISPV